MIKSYLILESFNVQEWCHRFYPYLIWMGERISKYAVFICQKLNRKRTTTATCSLSSNSLLWKLNRYSVASNHLNIPFETYWFTDLCCDLESVVTKTTDECRRAKGNYWRVTDQCRRVIDELQATICESFFFYIYKTWLSERIW